MDKREYRFRGTGFSWKAGLLSLLLWPLLASAAPDDMRISDRASIDCGRVAIMPKAGAIAKALCSGPKGAAADWDLNATLWAIAGVNDAAAQKSFDAQQDGWRRWLNQNCFMAESRLPGQDRTPDDECIFREFHKHATALRKRLSGDALAEALLTPEQRAQIQLALGVKPNGEFGPETRAAIRKFQLDAGTAPTGFFTAEVRARLLASSQNSHTAGRTSPPPSPPPVPPSALPPAATQKAAATVDLRLRYDGNNVAAIEHNGLNVRVDKEKAGEGRLPVATVTNGDKTITLRIKEQDGVDEPVAAVRILTLDPSVLLPQVALSYYWHGAHCCTVTTIASTDGSGNFFLVDGQILDGDGYEFNDIDFDGVFELVSVDNSFLYAFASYAASYAPPRIERLAGNQLVDVTRSERFVWYLSDKIRGMEQSADWEQNGFLAGWVAAKSQLGEFAQAWKKMLQTYDRKSDWSLESCLVGLPLDKCPAGSKVNLEFPEALARHLVKGGYISPSEAQTAIALWKQTASLRRPQKAETNRGSLDNCVGARTVVERIVAGQLIGRKLATNDQLKAVTANNDFTLDAIDDRLGKTVCAVTVSIDMRLLVSELANRNDMRAAAQMSQLATRRGKEVSRRVRFTVQPTSSAGQIWVTVLQ
jgi:peptidoglycan hydrolase-like protein with peptidoglycan-binding domain